ncbi:Gfo/Idh/MocA family oxidoreductase [Prolixibacteraceae bacterium Z1-6]|uniref:Gfo/Idh/MocA family oxidoreductase n=1 Tax=Draconibacterium aestuarii TaxID=2998507 RepID=A0A9X3J5L0_9BACT|nr:Gfo/Idh/MocA family oxidoreductase [Prolixibacteraceae bacterium Z1-6]
MKIDKKNTINWGIIGVGDVTEVKSGPAFYKSNNSKLVAVMRRNAQKAADYAKRHNIFKWYSNASELINDPDVDAVYIATPPDSHASYAIETMQAGKPVYVEKPMARSYAECVEMLKVSKETGMPLWVAYYRRTLPAFLKVKELLEAGVIGKPLMVNIKLYKQANERNQTPEEMHWHVFPEISGAGHFFDLASHQLDYLDFIFEEVVKVKGNASNVAALYPAEDTVSGTWEHKSGVIGTGSWCFVVDKNSEEDYIQIIGEKGEICLPCFIPGNVKLKTDDGITELKFQNPEHISQNLVQQVVDELRGNGKCISTGESAARTSWVLDEMVKDYYKDQRL